MRFPRRLALVIPLGFAASALVAQYSGVERTVHNLSVSGPGDVKSQTETEICKFCHIPHTAVVQRPLWGHQLSRVQQYDTAPLRGSGRDAAAPQPDGSSRLCLSCHDGTVALGDLAGPRRGRELPMPKLRRGESLGVDLSGSHPISFVVAERETAGASDRDMAVRPMAAIRADRDVRLDANGKIQCTTCHDPHFDRYYIPGVVPHFSVKSSVTEICLTCHEVR